jgi:hypothetical protein
MDPGKKGARYKADALGLPDGAGVIGLLEAKAGLQFDYAAGQGAQALAEGGVG